LKHQNDLAAVMKNGNLLHVCACVSVNLLDDLFHCWSHSILSRQHVHLVWLNSHWCSMDLHVSVYGSSFSEI